MDTNAIPKKYPTNSLLTDTAVVLNSQVMSDAERPRSIRLPQWLWDEIDRDAVRCKRSSVKQMEVVLTAYYRGDSTGLATDRLDAMKGSNGATHYAKDIKLQPEADLRKQRKDRKVQGG
jgi:hypothetical protein